MPDIDVIEDFKEKDENLDEQIKNLPEITINESDEWMQNIWNEFDWITRNKPKISEALNTLQEKLRPLEDRLAEIKKVSKEETEEVLEIEKKIEILTKKIKEIYNLYKKK